MISGYGPIIIIFVHQIVHIYIIDLIWHQEVKIHGVSIAPDFYLMCSHVCGGVQILVVKPLNGCMPNGEVILDQHHKVIYVCK